MAWAQEIIDFVMKAKPWTTVNEYENGLYFLGGKVMTAHLGTERLKWVLQQRKESGFGKRITLEQVLEQEKEMKAYYKKNKCLPPEKIAEGWYRGFWSMWNVHHPERATKNLPYGIYPHIPPLLDLSRVEVVTITEVVKELKFMSSLSLYDKNDTLLIDDTGFMMDMNGLLKKLSKELYTETLDKYIKHASPLSLTGITRYKIEDAYKAYTKVTDWERSYQSQILLMLSESVREIKLNDWLEPEKVKKFLGSIKDKLNGGDIRKEWGIYTIDFGITEITTKNLVRQSQELYVPDEGLKIKMDMPK